MTTANMLALMIDAESCSAWRYSANDKQWIIIYLKGDESYVHHNSANTLDELLLEVSDCLNDNSLQQSLMHILFSPEAAGLLTKAVETLYKYKVKRWQLLDVAYWQERVALSGIEVPDLLSPVWQSKHLLPLLTPPAKAVTKTKPELAKAEAISKLADTFEIMEHLHTLQQDNARLTTLNAQYMEQIRALHADMESNVLVNPAQRRDTLIAFLPIIFKDFWSKVTPATVATLLNTQQLPDIPSPFHNPDIATVLAKKKQFIMLSPAEQQGIWQFCNLLDYHHLKMHPEFKPLFEAWQQQAI